MYVIDFFKNIFRKNNIGVLIWLFFNTIISSVIFGAILEEAVGNSVIAILLGAVIYLIILAISLSSVGEAILRLMNGCKKIQRREYLERLQPIFGEVYYRAKVLNPELPDDIQFYMCDDEAANAFATGRKTICITKGLLRYSDAHIKAVLGHEFGHLAHKDTDAVLVIAVGNLIITTLFVIYRVVFRIISFIFQFGIALASKSLGTLIATTITNIFIDFLLGLMMKAWTKLGVLLCLHSARKNEYLADAYSYQLGYGFALCHFLDNLDSCKSQGLWAALNSSHPDHDDRIGYLQNLGCSYRGC